MQMEQMETSDAGFKDYLDLVLDRKWIVLLVFLLVVIAAVYYAETAPPVYQSMAVLMSESNQMTASVFPMMNPFYYRGPMEYLANLERLMVTAEFSARVVKQMSQEQNIDVEIYEVLESISLNNPKRTQMIEVIAESSNQNQVSILANIVADVLIETTSEIKNSDTSRAIVFLTEQMNVVDKKLRDSEERLNKFKEEEGIIAGMTTTVDTSSFGAKYGGGRYVRASLVSQLTEYQTQLTVAQNERELAQAQLDSINDMIAEKKGQLALTEEIDHLVGSITPQIEQLQRSIARWQVEIAVLQENFTDKHPKVTELRQRIDSAQQQLQSELNNMIAEGRENVSIDPIAEWQSLVKQALGFTMKVKSFEHQGKFAERKLAEFRKNNPDLLDKEVQLVRLEREARIREKTYMLLTDRFEEMQLLEQVNAKQFRMMDKARMPRFPISPNKKRIITLGVLLGMMLSVSIVFLLEYLDDSIRRVDDAEKRLGLPLIGSIPRIQATNSTDVALPQASDRASQSLASVGAGKIRNSDRDRRKGLEVLQGRLIKNIGHKSAVAESYRSLWTNIQFANLDEPVKTVLVTSPSPKEGKSLTTANLALTIAQADLRVLLIDADLRRPTAHRLFGCQRDPGLSELITEDVGNLENYVTNTYADNLYVLPSGKVPPNPVGILGSDKMKLLVEEAKKRYDLVLFDSPPVVAMADASVLAKGLDLTLLVLQVGQTKYQVAKQAKDLLDRLDVSIFGVVFNGVDFSRRSGQYYYYYHYHDYYSKEETDEVI